MRRGGIVCGVAAVLVQLLTLAGTVTAGAPASVTNGPIFFSSLDPASGSWDVFSVAPDGTELTRLTDHPYDDWAPSVSPDGKRVAFISYRDGAGRVYVMRPDGSGVRPFARAPRVDGGRLSWSPDGSRIVYARSHRGRLQLYIARADGARRPRRITALRGDVGTPDWSPNGRRIVFAVRSDISTADLYTVRPSGKGMKKVTRGAQAYQPSWSPDGRAIVFASFRAMEGWGQAPCTVEVPYAGLHSGKCEIDIYVVRADGRRERQLTDATGADWNPMWSPDRTSIIFLSDRPGTIAATANDIFVMQRDGSDQRPLVVTEGWEWGLSWQKVVK